MKTLVAYFSASGTTAKVAAKLAKALKADVHEIQPEKVYTSADLDWTNSRSRSSREKNDQAFRPAIANKISGLDQYDRVLVGFPIWWYTAPSIIKTFLEGYSWEGKKIGLFATSGGSGMGNTASDLKPSCNEKILSAKRFSSNISEQELQAWAEKIG